MRYLILILIFISVLGRFAYCDSSEVLSYTPDKPKAKTIVGSVLLGEGVLAIGGGAILWGYTKSNAKSIGLIEGTFRLIISALLVIEGSVCSISGGVVLSKAKKEWDIYNKYHEEENIHNDTQNGTQILSICISF